MSGDLKGFCDMYAPKFGADPEAFNELMRSMWDEMRIGKADSNLFWKRLADFLKIDEKTVRRDLIDFSGFRHDVFELAKKLKVRYKLAILSNQIENWFEEIIEKHRMGEVFDVIVTSYGSRIAKPDIGIYNEVIRRLGVKPSECVFVDDLETNMSPAKKLGMKTILFKDTEQLKNDLKKLGVKF